MIDYPNIIIIVLDTLRKDVLSIYGGNAETPNIDSFSKDSVIFNNAVAPSSWTVPSHVSLFTGLYPNRHGVHEDFEVGPQNIFVKLKRFRGTMITKKLKDFGYSNFGFSSNGYVSPGSGFENFFDYLNYIDNQYNYLDYRTKVDQLMNAGHSKAEIIKNYLMEGKVMNLIAIYKMRNSYLRRRKMHGYPLMKGSDSILETIKNSHFEAPFFLFINFVEVHDPVAQWELKKGPIYPHADLMGLKKINDSMIKQVKEKYKIALGNLDKQIGELFAYFRKRKIYDNSLIVLTSDHGQSMKENRRFPYYGHGNFIYDELTHIPMIVKFPGNKKTDQRQGYQSLTKIPELIENVIEGNDVFDISERAVFSESHGWAHDYIGLIKSGGLPKETKWNDLKNKIFYPRKAVYKDGYKLSINQLNGEIDEFLFKGKEISVEYRKTIVDDLLNELERFSKQ